MNTNILRTVFAGMALALAFASPADEAVRSHPRQSKLTTPVKQAEQAEQAEEVLAPRIRGDRNQPSEALQGVPRLRMRQTTKSDAMPIVAGGVIHSDTWGGTKKYGVYSLSPTSSTMIVDKVKATDGGVLKDDVFYAHEMENDDIFDIKVYAKGYDINTGDMVYDKESYFANRVSADMTVDPTTGTVYGIFWKDDDMTGYMLGTINYSNFRTSKIVDLPGDWCAIAADNDGKLYAIRREIENGAVKSSALYLIVDAYEGEVAKIGDTGQQPLYQSSMTYDAAGDRLLWNVCPADNSGAIYEVSLTTGVATHLYDLPGNEEIMGLYIPAKTDGTVPAAPTDMTFDFDGGSLEGSIGFTAPSQSIDGSALEGELKYTVSIDGSTQAEGSCTPGQIVDIPVTFNKRGNHEVNVSVSNDSGNSQALKANFYAGFATPKAPGNVKMSVSDDNTATVTWDAVTTAATQGYFAAADVRYNVVMNPGNVSVAENTDKTMYSGPLPTAEGYASYSFTVNAVMGDAISAGTKSNSYSTGTIEPPYLEDFADASSLDAFTIIDRWRYDKKGFVYSSYANGNAWLITPPIKLKGGNIYKLTYDAKADMGSWDAEKMEIKLGTAPTEEAMTTTVVEAFEITSESFVNYSGTIAPESDGLYYIGFHNLINDGWGLQIDNISIEAPLDNNVPATVADFTAHGDADGKMKVNISLTAPALTFQGQELKSLDKIEILRGNELKHTFTTPTPGEHLEWSDENPAAGLNEYTAIAYTSAGASEAAKATAFAGLDKPAMPTNLKVVEIEEGVVTVSWDRVSTGVHGGPINPSLITYDIASYMSGDMDINALNLTTNSATFRATPAGSQVYIQFVVFPIIAVEGGDEIEGEPAMSEQMPIGTPDDGFRESFRNGICQSTLAMNKGYRGGVSLHTDADGVSSQDGDNGIISITGSAVGANASIQSGKIDLSDMVNPALTFYSFTIADSKTGQPSNNKLEVSIAEAGGEFTTLLSTTASEISPDLGWQLVSVPLDSYAGKTIIFKIGAEVVDFSNTPLDNIRVGSSVAHDIAIAATAAPGHVRAGDDYKVSVRYTNLGTEAVDKFDLALYADGKLLQTLPCQRLEAGASGARQFSVTMHPLSTDDVELQARAILASDGNTSNDAGAAVAVTPVVSIYPTVTDLEGRLDNSGKASLTWSEPAYDDFAVPEAVNETVENAVSFASELEGWTFVDGDHLPTGTFKNVKFPGITDGEQHSFYVVDGASEAIPSQFRSSFAAVSGSKYLAAMYARGGRNDDWAISPELSGEMQYVSFHAKSYSSSVSEELEVLASSQGTDIADFTVIGKIGTVPHAWTPYEFRLPAGTRHFAIRYCANDAMMLMIDDIRYIAKGDDDRLSLKGFNIYRNEMKVNAEPVEDFEYVDTEEADRNNKYVVTAVYTHGESAASNEVSVNQSSITDVTEGNISINGGKGVITVAGAEGYQVKVFTPDGKCVASVTASAWTQIPVAAGIYIVTADTSTAKVAVK